MPEARGEGGVLAGLVCVRACQYVCVCVCIALLMHC